MKIDLEQVESENTVSLGSENKGSRGTQGKRQFHRVSSFYDRDEMQHQEALLDELAGVFTHKVSICEYLIKGVDHLGQKTLNQYSIVKPLGAGSFGTVSLVHVNETHEDFAMKTFSKRTLKKRKDVLVKDEQTGKYKAKDMLQAVRKEIEIMSKLSSDNTVRLHEVIDLEDADQLIMVMDYCAHGEIMRWNENTLQFRPIDRKLDYYSEETIRKFARDLVQGLQYLHEQNIVHRDIKPMNILLHQSGVANYADFGSAEFITTDNDTLCGTEGTYHFFSPELCDPNVNEYSAKAADIWALGVTLYCMVYNKLPFDADNELEIFQVILKQEPNFEARQVTGGLKDLIQKMLTKEVSQRAKIVDLLQHSWLNEGYQLNLDEQGAQLFKNLSKKEIEKKGVSTDTMQMAEQIANQLQKRRNTLQTQMPDMVVKRRLSKQFNPTNQSKLQQQLKQIHEQVQAEDTVGEDKKSKTQSSSISSESSNNSESRPQQINQPTLSVQQQDQSTQKNQIKPEESLIIPEDYKLDKVATSNSTNALTAHMSPIVDTKKIDKQKEADDLTQMGSS